MELKCIVCQHKGLQLRSIIAIIMPNIIIQLVSSLLSTDIVEFDKKGKLWPTYACTQYVLYKCIC